MHDAALAETRADLSILAREERPPTWAMLAPLLYLAACALGIRAVMLDRTMEYGIAGILVAAGFAPAFAMPAIWSTRKVRLAASPDGLVIDGRALKTNDVRIARADRGTAQLVVEMRTGTSRTFIIASYADAQKLMAQLPPVSAPAGALAEMSP